MKILREVASSVIARVLYVIGIVITAVSVVTWVLGWWHPLIWLAVAGWLVAIVALCELVIRAKRSQPEPGSNAWLIKHAADPGKMVYEDGPPWEGEGRTGYRIRWPDKSAGWYEDVHGAADLLKGQRRYSVTYDGPGISRKVVQPERPLDAEGKLGELPDMVVYSLK